MAKVFSESIVTAIDIGTTKICVLIAKQIADDVEILGIGKAPSHGLKKGMVTDIAKTVQSIKAAVKEAELISGYAIDTATVGISGSHIRAFNSHGAVPIKKGGSVRAFDVAAVVAAAKAIPIPEGQQILHVLPQYFTIDGQEKIQDPHGMHGVRLEAQVHIITGSISSAQNIIMCCQMADIRVTDIVLEQLASAQAVLSDDERELGVAILDIGGGTSDFAVFRQGSIRHTMVLPIAGNHFTNDVAIGLNTTLKEAERIKQLHGFALATLLDHNQELHIEMTDGTSKQTIQQAMLVNIIEQRAREMLSLINQEIITYKLTPFLATGVVLTGGGSLLKGMAELARSMFGMPVRIGAPKIGQLLPESLNNPIYATGYGLLLHAMKKEKTAITESNNPLVYRVFDRMKSWMSDFF